MQPTAVNPTRWGLGSSTSRGDIVDGAAGQPRCSSPVALVPDDEAELGLGTAHVGDIRGHIGWIDPARVVPPPSPIGATRLVMPDLLVEIAVRAAP